MANATRQLNTQKGQDSSVSSQVGSTEQRAVRSENPVERNQTQTTAPATTKRTIPAQIQTTTERSPTSLETTAEDYAFSLTFSILIKNIPCEEIP